MISALLSSPLIVAIGGAVVAILGLVFKSRLDGARLERAKRDAEEKRARDLADEIQNDVGALPPDAAKTELRKWSRG